MYRLQKQLQRGKIEVLSTPETAVQQLNDVEPIDQDEQDVIDFIFGEFEKREHESIQLQQLRGILHQQQVHPSRLGWPSKAILEKTLNNTTQFATHVTRDPTRRWLKKETGINHRSNNIVATDPIVISELMDEPLNAATTVVDPAYPNKRRKTTTLKYYQLFVECGPTTSAPGSGYMDGYVMKHKSDFHIALKDYIRNNSIPKQLWMDGAKEENSENVKDVLRMFHIRDSIRSAPEAQHQNPVEGRGVNRFKRAWNTITLNSKLDYNFELPLQHWPYKAEYIVETLNHRATSEGSGNNQWRTPIERKGDPTPDLSKFRFGFGEWVVYFLKAPFPANQLHIGRSLGPAPEGNYLNQRILTSGGVISRAAVESVYNIKAKGLKLKSSPSTELRGDERSNPVEAKEPTLDNMMDDYSSASKEEDDERKAEYTDLEAGLEAITDEATNKDPTIAEVQEDEIVTSPTVDGQDEDTLQNKEEDETRIAEKAKEDGYYYAHKIVGYSSPRGEQMKRYPNISTDSTKTKRNQLFLLICWGPGYEGQDSYESFTTLKHSSPELVADYIRGEFGQDSEKQSIPSIKKAIEWANVYQQATDVGRVRIQALSESGYFDTEHKSPAIEKELRGGEAEPPVTAEADPMSIFKIGVDENARIQYGRRCPRIWLEALRLEEQDGVYWTQAAKQECVDKLIMKYDVFELGEKGAECPEGYQPIKLKTVYTNGPDNKIKARCCAVGCGVDSGPLNRYFSVVDHSHARAVMTKALSDGAELRIVDVKSAYVTCRAQEKVWVKSLPPEFGEFAGRSATVKGNLYGLNTAGAVWAVSCQTALLKMGFSQSPHDRAIYYREIQTDDGPEYEYVCTYVDDFILASKRMDELTDELSKIWEFKHSTNMEGGVRYVGADCKHDKIGRTLDIHCHTYIQEALEHIEGYSKKESQRGIKKFNLPHIERKTPMLEDDHPESLEGEEAEFLDEGDTRTYQSYIGALNWCCTLCRIDIEYSVNALSSYNAAPRVGHARRVMRIWGYLKAHPNMGVRLDPTDFFDLEDEDSTLTPEQREHLKIEYGDLEEECDPNDPRPLGKALTLTGMADADHAHNQVDRRSTNGRIIFLGRGILAWKSKRQVGCEGSSYGSELRAMASTARELRGYRMFLRGIGIPVKGTSLLFVDNAAALYAASNLATTLKVKHLSIDYHTLRELTAWGVIQPEKVPTEQNLADVLTKPTSRQTFWRLINQLMVVPLGKSVRKGTAALVQMLSCKG